MKSYRLPRNEDIVIDLFHTDWETADLKKLREEQDAELLASGKVTQEWLDKYGDASFDAAMAVLGIIGPHETVDSAMAARATKDR